MDHRLIDEGKSGNLESYDAVIGDRAHEHLQPLAERGMPVVALVTGTESPAVPRVTPDHAVAGRLGAAHLTSRRLEHFAGFCDQSTATSAGRIREAAFAEVVAASGLGFASFFNGPRTVGGWNLAGQIEDLAEWLTELPKPLGLFCGDDDHGLRALAACRRAGLRVPDDVAILACHNDRVICDFASPTLSSIEFDQPAAGYAAAQLLDGLLEHGRRPPPVTLIPPVGVVARRSSDTFATDDTYVRDAVRFIRDQVERSLDVLDVTAHVGLSRPALHRRFVNALGRSIQAEIQRARLERVKWLLATTDLPLLEIAVRSGYASSSHLARDFKRDTGQTAMQYRSATNHR